MKKTNRKNKAFTLVELLVVILIISLIATVLAPRVFKGLGKAKSDIAKAKMANIESAISRFYLDCGRYPDESLELEELVTAPADMEEKWRGPYLKQSELLDPWGNPYIYVQEGEINAGSFDLVSFGADGEEGGEGDNQDIFNE
jgi:general secretion pathway protein G